MLDQRGLPAAVLSQDRHKLAPANRAAQPGEGLGTVRIAVREAVHLQHRLPRPIVTIRLMQSLPGARRRLPAGGPDGPGGFVRSLPPVAQAEGGPQPGQREPLDP